MTRRPYSILSRHNQGGIVRSCVSLSAMVATHEQVSRSATLLPLFYEQSNSLGLHEEIYIFQQYNDHTDSRIACVNASSLPLPQYQFAACFLSKFDYGGRWDSYGQTA